MLDPYRTPPGDVSVDLLFWAMIGIIAYAGILAPWWRLLSPAQKQVGLARLGHLRRLIGGTRDSNAWH